MIIKLNIYSFVLALAVTTLFCFALNASALESHPMPKPEWLRASLTEPFKPQSVTGTVDGDPVVLNIATLQPFRDGAQQVLYLMQKKPDGTFYNVHVWVPLRGSLEGKTVYFPSKVGEHDASVAIYKKVGDHEHSTGASTDDSIAGRITFGKIQKGVIAGYICVRFGHLNCKLSSLNGYFHAKLVSTPKKYEMNMMK